MVFDLYPRKVVSSASNKKKITTKVGADLKFLASGLTGEFLSEFEHESYEPELFSYGVQTQQFRWKFRRTKQNFLEGDRILFATVGKPKGTQVLAEYKITVEIQTTAFHKLILDSRNDEAVNASYVFC